jgi:hypothetical protein
LNPIRRGIASNPGMKSLLHPMRSTALCSLRSLLRYEYALSFPFSLDRDRRLLVDNCLDATPAEHHAAIAFSNYE